MRLGNSNIVYKAGNWPFFLRSHRGLDFICPPGSKHVALNIHLPNSQSSHLPSLHCLTFYHFYSSRNICDVYLCPIFLVAYLLQVGIIFRIHCAAQRGVYCKDLHENKIQNLREGLFSVYVHLILSLYQGCIE